ncbi:uncharacterized protein LOC125128432 [Phacochoerus africanus]|uniref:uncharacterized protein LOC125128432 n=1 Tax=Phacochoerus africanus TaxID=41426 RepID=UPI001FDA4045|nr:uncharacterized protein LOC125128432 [Phacochoerus africanus]
MPGCNSALHPGWAAEVVVLAEAAQLRQQRWARQRRARQRRARQRWWRRRQRRAWRQWQRQAPQRRRRQRRLGRLLPWQRRDPQRRAWWRLLWQRRDLWGQQRRVLQRRLSRDVEAAAEAVVEVVRAGAGVGAEGEPVAGPCSPKPGPASQPCPACAQPCVRPAESGRLRLRPPPAAPCFPRVIRCLLLFFNLSHGRGRRGSCCRLTPPPAGCGSMTLAWSPGTACGAVGAERTAEAVPREERSSPAPPCRNSG